MTAVLDASVCIDFLRRHGPTVEPLMTFKSREVLIPAHAVVELEHGVYLSQRRNQVREAVRGRCGQELICGRVLNFYTT